MMWRIAFAVSIILATTLIVRAQFQVNGEGVGAPGTPSATLQFNTNGVMGGISGVTSDSANVGFATSSSLSLYGLTATTCLQLNAAHQIVSSGGACGGSGAPGGVNGNVQFNTNGSLGGISGANSTDASTIRFNTNSLVINGQAISGVSGTTGTLATVTGSLSANCVKGDGSGNLIDSGTTCGGGGGGGTTTSIVAGTNITTSGVATNTTVNVVATPSFTTVIASGNITAGTAQFTGLLTGTNAVFQTVTVNNLTPTGPNCLQETSGVLQATNTGCATQTATPSIAAGSNITTSGTAANTTVAVVASPNFTNVTASSNLTGATAQITGWLTAAGVNLQTSSIAGNLTAGTAQITGLLTGTNAVFQTMTVNNLTPTGPNCLQETGGVLQATNTPCASSVTTVSIAQGNNIVTSGTASNITVTATPTGASNTVQFNNAGVFGGDAGFQYNGGSTGIVTHTLGTVTTTNDRALSLIGTWSNSTTTFAAPFFINITTNTSSANTTSGFGVGSRLVDIQATSLSVLSISPSGAMASAALQSTATQCLQASGGGLVFGTAVPCATQVSTPSIAAGSNITTSGTAANTTINVVATPSFTTVISTSNLTASTVLGVVGWLTAPGVNMQTATLAGSLIGTSGNFSTNLTANIAQFAGFLSAGGASLAGLTIQTATFSSNLTGTTGNFSSWLTGQLGTFPGFLTATGLSAFTGTITQITNTTAFVTSVVGNAGTNSAGSISFLTNNVAQFGDGGINANGWYNWRGEARSSVDSQGFISTGFVNLLTINVNAGRTYKFDAELPLKSATASTGGIALRIGGGATVTNVVYDGWVIDSGFNGTKGNTQATALSTTVASTSITGTTSHATLIGTVTVNAAGTIILQASGFSTVTAASAVTVGRGATFIVEDMP